jgi:hypothetical protein
MRRLDRVDINFSVGEDSAVLYMAGSSLKEVK